MLPNISIRFIRAADVAPAAEVNADKKISLPELCTGRVGVIDLWHTQCTRCPAAIGKLNDIAESYEEKNVLFFTCALSQGEGDLDLVNDLVQDDAWSKLNHIFVDFEDRDALKSALQYSAVPFYVVFDQNGNIYKSGDSKSVDVAKTIDALLTTNAENAMNNKITSNPTTTTNNNTIAFDEDF